MSARARAEDGVALPLALAFLTLFGLWIASLLTFADTAARTTVQLRSVAANSFEVDGAVEGAIARLRSNLEAGRAGQRDWTCATVTNTDATATATATCTGGGGVAGGGTDNPSNRPARALLSLATLPAEPGIDHNAATALRTRGSIFSTNAIDNHASPAMIVDGDVTANGACTGTITSVYPPAHCSDSGTVASDPVYLTTISPPPEVTPPATCPAWLVQFTPGWYDDAPSLNSLTGGSCANKVFHFQPGTYYFDFANAGTHAWTINDATANVVGGEAKGWSTGDASKASPFPFPGGCKTNADGATTGVQFVFGGDSRMSITAGSVELCPAPSASAQQIAIYGLRTASSGGAVGPISLTPSSVTGTVGTWTNQSNALGALDSLTSDVTRNNTVSMTLGGYSAASIPSNATIVAATIRFAHRDEANVSSVTLEVTPGTGPPKCSVVAGTVSTALHTDTGDLTSCLSSVAKIDGMTATFESRRIGATTQIQHLDGVTLDVTYSLSTSPQSGCVTQQPYTGVGSACAMLTTGGPNTKLAVQGTVYAPLAALDITLSNVNYVVLSRGVISRVFRSAIATAGGYAGEVIRIPDDCPYPASTRNPTACTSGSRTDRTVTMTVSQSGAVRVIATATFADGTTAPITPGGTVQIGSWSFLR